MKISLCFRFDSSGRYQILHWHDSFELQEDEISI